MALSMATLATRHREDVSDQERLSDVLVAFLLQRCAQDLEGLLDHQQEDGYHAFPINLLDLAQHSPAAARELLRSPTSALQALRLALLEAQQTLAQRDQQGSRSQCHSIKLLAHPRLASLAQFLDAQQAWLHPGIGGVRSAHVGRLLTLAGKVVRTGPLQTLEAQRTYECARCSHRFTVGADLERGATLPLPQACPSQAADRTCRSTTFDVVKSVHTDYQEVRVQEQAQCLALGALPRSIRILLSDDLADSCRPGDDVEVTGVVTRQWGREFPGVRCDVEHVIVGNNVVRLNNRTAAAEPSPAMTRSFAAFWASAASCPLAARNRIVMSICPQIYGLFTVKLACLLMLIGGVARTDEGGTHIRGQVHMLLVGDPGTGKSQFMKWAARLAERAVVTTGKGSSGAGLTVAAVKEGGQWALEAGALVLADGGLCCIDEFDGMRESERATIHEAMEQQTVSVAKAGLVTTLSTRTTVLGVTNPRGTYDPREPLTANVNLSGPLLSRFDVVLVLRDALNPDWDEAVADHILAAHQADGAPAATLAAPASGPPAADVDDASMHSQAWPLERLRAYIAWVKQAFQPAMTAEAEAVLLGYWRAARAAAGRQAPRSTVRMLESLVRLAQAHARLMARGAVTQQDAVVAISMVEACDSGTALFATGSSLHSSVPPDPDADHARLEARLLAALSADEDFAVS